MQPEELIPLKPRELILELSHNCNLSCQMCGFVKERNQPGYLMTEDTLNQVLEAFDATPEVVRLNGRGESTIHPKFPDFLQRIRAKWPQAALHLFTNLNIKDEDRVLLLKQSRVQLFISIDSPDPEELARIRKGAKWDLMQRNFSLLQDTDPRPFLVFTMQAENVHRIADIAKLAHGLKAGLIYNVVRSDMPDYRLQNRVISEWEAIKSQMEEAYQLMKSSDLPCFIPDQIQGIELGNSYGSKTNGRRNSCPALERETCVQYDGHVTPCNMFHPKVLGHIRGGKISKILSSHEAKQFRVDHKTHPYCINCAWLGGDS